MLHANQLCDELGLDTISTGNLIGAVMEGYENGIISLEDLDGRPITWGDEEAAADLIHKISDIGAHHARAWTIAKELEEGDDWSDEEKVDLVIYHQSLRPLFDMLGVCRFPWIELGLNEEHYARFYSHVTGKTMTLDELLKKSADVYDLTRLINVRTGMDRKDDTMPYKVHALPIRSGATAGRLVEKDQFERPSISLRLPVR